MSTEHALETYHRVNPLVTELLDEANEQGGLALVKSTAQHIVATAVNGVEDRGGNALEELEKYAEFERRFQEEFVNA